MNDGSGKSRFRPRIVMIDDEKSNLQIVKIIIMRENLESDLSLFENGASALEFIQKNPVDLILLDLAMPEMDGFEIMSRLQADPNTADIPVIFLSAYQEASYILKAFDLGATDFIGKPIISPILTARIRQIIKSRSLEKELRLRNTELVDTNRLKDELLSICSHDLRAPLSAIELICQFLEDTIHERSETSQQELVNRIVSQSRLARRLVENLLDLNRIEQGRLVPASSLFSVDELLEQCVKEEDPNLLSRDLEFELSRDESRDAVHHPTTRPFAANVDVTIIRVTHESVASSFKLAVEIVEHDVAQQRRKRTALRRALFRRTNQAILHHSGVQKRTDEFEQPPIGYPPGDATHQHVVVDPIEELLQIDVHHPAAALGHILLCLRHRLMGRTSRTESVARCC